jgi:hypothetical protein
MPVYKCVFVDRGQATGDAQFICGGDQAALTIAADKLLARAEELLELWAGDRLVGALTRHDATAVRHDPDPA